MRKYFNIFEIKKRKGQAFAELSIMMAVLLVLVFGAIEFAKMISMSTRMAAVAREAGRTINAQDYDPDQMDDAFGVITNMVFPANLQTEGRVIVSIVQRVAGSSTSTFITTPSDTNRDYLIISDRFYYPYSGTNTRMPATNSAVTSWLTKLPETFDNGLTNTSRRYVAFSNNVGIVPLEMLLPSGKTAVVEVYYTNRLNTPIRELGVNIPAYMYDVAAF